MISVYLSVLGGPFKVLQAAFSRDVNGNSSFSLWQQAEPMLHGTRVNYKGKLYFAKLDIHCILFNNARLDREFYRLKITW